jgi:hypothetical protein
VPLVVSYFSELNDVTHIVTLYNFFLFFSGITVTRPIARQIVWEAIWEISQINQINTQCFAGLSFATI